jgi:hypothetical protein
VQSGNASEKLTRLGHGIPLTWHPSTKPILKQLVEELPELPDDATIADVPYRLCT